MSAIAVNPAASAPSSTTVNQTQTTVTTSSSQPNTSPSAATILMKSSTDTASKSTSIATSLVSPSSASSTSASTIASSTSSSPSTVDVTSRQNRLAVPGLLGDPFTAFDVDLATGSLVSGSAMGSIALWRLDQVSDLLIRGKERSTDTGEILCRQLSSSSDEGVKHVFIREQQVFAVIGDVHVKIFGSWHDTSCQQKRFDRSHEYKTCKESVTLRANMQVLVLTVGTHEGVLLDLETMMQTPFKLDIPSYSVPLCFTGTHLLLLQHTDNGVKLVQIYEVHSQRLVKTLILERSKKFYWGFQLVDTTAPSAAGASSATDNISGTSSLGLNFGEHKSNHHSDPAREDHLFLSYVSNHGTVKTIPFRSLPPPLSYQEAATIKSWSTIRATHPSARDQLCHRVDSAKHAARILAFIHDVAAQQLITLNSDGKLKVFEWNPSADNVGNKATTGTLLKKYRGIAGTFKLGYPYLLKKFNNIVFYSADEGIFVLRLD